MHTTQFVNYEFFVKIMHEYSPTFMFLITDCKRKKRCFVKCSCVVNYCLYKCHFDLGIDEGMVLEWILGNKV